MDEEITNDNNMQLLLDDLKALSSKTNIEYIIKSRIKNNIELTDDDLKSDNKKKLILFNKK
jgi:SHS2 domain-containing protein